MQPMHEFPFCEHLWLLHASIAFAMHVHHHPLPALSACVCTCHNVLTTHHRALHTSTLTAALLPIIHQSSCRNATEEKEKNISSLYYQDPLASSIVAHSINEKLSSTFLSTLCLHSSAGSIGIMLTTRALSSLSVPFNIISSIQQPLAS